MKTGRATYGQTMPERLEESPESAYPLALAPFIAAKISIGSGQTVDDDPAGLERLENRLRDLAGAEKAKFDIDNGLFELTFEEEGSSLSLGSRIRVAVAPWASEGAYPARSLHRLSGRQAEALRFAVKRIWDTMIRQLWALTCNGYFQIIAKINSPVCARYTIIPPRTWNYFLIENWAEGVSLCKLSGDRLWDIRFERLPLDQVRNVASAKGKRACIAWLVGCREGNKRPMGNRDFYRDLAMREFEVGPDQFKTCWREAAKLQPNRFWGLPGRRPGAGFQPVGQ